MIIVYVGRHDKRHCWGLRCHPLLLWHMDRLSESSHASLQSVFITSLSPNILLLCFSSRIFLLLITATICQVDHLLEAHPDTNLVTLFITQPRMPQCGLVMRWIASVSTYIFVSPVRALTFERLDLQGLRFSYRYIFRTSR